MEDGMINFENVSKYIISDFSLNVPEGEAVGIIGRSGAGKTTLIKLACGFLSPESGKVWTLRKDPVRYRGRYAADLSVFIAGVPLLDNEDTVRQGHEMISAMYRIPRSVFERRYAELSEQLGFAELSDARIRDLSLGQKMRAELGAALIYEPKVLLLDEPTVGLDENGKTALGEILIRRRRSGMTVLLTSHDMPNISKMCTRLVIADKGKMVFCGSEDDLRTRYLPINTMTVRFTGNIPDLDDLPLKKYAVEGNRITIEYNSNHITSAEIIALMLKQTEISEVNIHKPSLEDIAKQQEVSNELN